MKAENQFILWINSAETKPYTLEAVKRQIQCGLAWGDTAWKFPGDEAWRGQLKDLDEVWHETFSPSVGGPFAVIWCALAIVASIVMGVFGCAILIGAKSAFQETEGFILVGFATTLFFVSPLLAALVCVASNAQNKRRFRRFWK